MHFQLTVVFNSTATSTYCYLMPGLPATSCHVFPVQRIMIAYRGHASRSCNTMTTLPNVSPRLFRFLHAKPTKTSQMCYSAVYGFLVVYFRLIASILVAKLTMLVANPRKTTQFLTKLNFPVPQFVEPCKSQCRSQFTVNIKGYLAHFLDPR